MAHQARLPIPPPVDPPPELEVTAETQHTLGQFTLSMSFEERLHGLAVEGGLRLRMVSHPTTAWACRHIRRMWHRQVRLRYIWRQINGKGG
jgi:hypothetical protein